MNNIVLELKKVKTFYLATIDNNSPRVRPFGSVMEYDGEIYLCTGNFKEVYKQIQNNNHVELCGMYDEVSWLRVSGEVIEDNRLEVQQAMLEDETGPKGLYEAGDGKFATFKLVNAKATKYSFFSAPQEIK